MSSRQLGTPTSVVEVTNVSGHGFWLLARAEELFLSFEDFPWFQHAPSGKVVHVIEPAPGHYYWPELDIDLGLETIRHPDRYPLKVK